MTIFSPWNLHRVSVQVIAPGQGCQCGGSSLVRRDTGLCERCTAQTPEAKQAWEDWRRVCAEGRARRSTAVPAGSCIVCEQPLGEISQHRHNPYCTAKAHACGTCGRRYSTAWELRKHRLSHPL